MQPYDLIMLVATIVSTIAAVIGTAAALRTARQKREQKAIQAVFAQRLEKDFFDADTIARATRYYVVPDCSTSDPTHINEQDLSKTTGESLFTVIDQFLDPTSPVRHLYVLGDSGTGKTAFALNYYARNYRLPPSQQHKIAIIPLGVPDAAKYLDRIEDQHNTVLFLDAFDEDTAAIKNPEQRFAQLIKRYRNFRRVVITSRSQFFPSDKAIQLETGTERQDDRPAGQPSKWKFEIRYLLPLRDAQVNAYLRKRYFWPFGARRRAFQLVKQAPTLAIRPMLLAYIPDLVRREITFSYTFQLYEAMVEAWIVREKDIDSEVLREFSGHLAVDLYRNREKRGAEWIDRDELAPLARCWKINLEEWQMTSRSLLNRADAAGHYKFAHRSIMEYLLVKRLFAGSDDCLRLKRTDQMNTFLVEMLLASGSLTNRPGTKDLACYPLALRMTAIENLDNDSVQIMLTGRGFFDSMRNERGKGIAHLYQRLTNDHIASLMPQFIIKHLPNQMKQLLVIDHATGLMWLPVGGTQSTYFTQAREVVKKMNREKFSGYSDWRLPTLEEVMSLMEPEKKNNNLHIDPIFMFTKCIWTGDLSGPGTAWYVNFNMGDCRSEGSRPLPSANVCAVRSGQP